MNSVQKIIEKRFSDIFEAIIFKNAQIFNAKPYLILYYPNENIHTNRIIVYICVWIGLRIKILLDMHFRCPIKKMIKWTRAIVYTFGVQQMHAWMTTLTNCLLCLYFMLFGIWYGSKTVRSLCSFENSSVSLVERLSKWIWYDRMWQTRKANECNVYVYRFR